MAVTVYKSDGPTLDGAVKVTGKGPSQVRSSRTASGPGMESSSPQQSQVETATVGSMPAVNTLTVESNQDGTIGIKTSVADAMPETGPGVTNRNGSASANTNSVITVGVQTGWVQLENGYKYFKEDGSGYKTGWHEEYSADGGKIWYYFDEEPENKEWMVTGWKKIKNGKGILCWYHFREDGKMSRYWVHLKGMWYYLEPRDDAGYMVTDWHIINGDYYYFVPDDVAGYMMIDWFEIRGKWYYFYNSDEKRGIMAHDYLMRHTDGNLYYLQEKNDGSMAVNKEITDLATGIVYFADENGVCTIVESVKSGDLEEILKSEGYPAGKAHSMAVAYDACTEPTFERNFAIGMMANIFHEGAAGKLEGNSGKDYWTEAPKSIRDLAGKIITNETMARTWLNDTPRRSGYGVGSIQWSWPSRRDGILNAYLQSATTWSSEELGGIEVHYMITELEGGYNSNVVVPCKGQSPAKCAEIICNEYEKPSNRANALSKRRREAEKLNNILSKHGY